MNSSIRPSSISGYHPKMKTLLSSSSTTVAVPICSSNLKLKTPLTLTKLSVKCSSSNPLGPASGETDSNGVLDAFFLGKALAEAINERIESTVGEVLSVVGRFQAEQQKQVQEFQEDVLERAKRAKEQAAKEAQGLDPKTTTAVVVSTAAEVSDPIVVTPDSSAYSSPKTRDPFIGMMLVEED